MHSSILIAALAGLAAAAPGSRLYSRDDSNATCTDGAIKHYTVKSGDTLTKISQKFSSGICNIAKANGLSNPNVINIDQVLLVPTKVCDPDNTSCLSTSTATATCATGVDPTYKIVSGDTFYVVAQRLGITTDSLLNANPGVDPSLLQVGQVINIPICK